MIRTAILSTLLFFSANVQGSEKRLFAESDINDEFAKAYIGFVNAKSSDSQKQASYTALADKFINAEKSATNDVLKKRCLWHSSFCNLLGSQPSEKKLTSMPLNIDAKNNPFAASIIELLELKRLYLKYSKLLSAKNLPDDHSYDNGNAEFCIKNIDECCISKSLAHKKLLQSACYYKLKILGKLLHLYALENKGKIPKYLDFKTRTTYSKTLKAFIKSKNLADENCIKQIFHCPEVPDGSVGYGMNIFLELLYSSEIAKVKDPSKICLLADSVHYFKGSYPSNPLYKGGNFSIWARIEHNGVGTIDRKRHNGGTNVLFLDGHVEWLPLEKSIKNSTFWRGY